MAVVASATGAAVFGLSGVAAGLAGGALLGAGIGGLYSAFTGDGDILNSMLTGGLIGGAAGGLGAGYAGATAAAEAATAAGATGLGTVGPAATTVATPTAASMAAMTPAQAAAMTPAQLNAIAASQGVLAEGAAALPGAGLSAAPNVITPAMVEAGKVAAGSSKMNMLGYGLAGTAAMQLLGGKGKGAQAPASAGDPGMIRPFEYTSTPNEPTGNYPSPYATAQYDKAGNPIMDTRERNYFNQDFAALQPYSAKTGTVNPNIPLSTSNITSAANGGIMRNYDDELGTDDIGSSTQGNMQKGLFALGYAHGGVPRYADRGMVDEEAELRKTVMNNLKRLSPEQMQNVMGNFQEEGMREKQFLMKNMPNYSAVMAPSISSMVEGAQYGDRMAQSYNDITKAKQAQMGQDFVPQTDYARFQPRVQDLNNYGGIASIGQQVDPDTRVNMMADLQRTPYDRNALESVRRVGAGVDRKIGKDANLSAYYEQDPMGRNKTGGVRYTQNFGFGGLADSIVAQLTAQDLENSTPKYSYDQIAQRYNQVSGGNPSSFQGNSQFNYDAKDQKYTQMAQGGATDLGDYSDGGRLLKGPGDGVSDDIPATIAGKQPARLADGEFVIPARIVSEIGNGSTDAGAKRLYAMMDRIQAGRKKTIGKKNVAKDTKAKKHLLA